MSATESELQNELPDVCYAWSKQFGDCGEDSVPTGLNGELVCCSKTKRSHICHICHTAGKTEFHRGSVCIDEESKERHKERERTLRKQRRKWAQDLRERNEEMSSKWAKGSSKGGDRLDAEEE